MTKRILSVILALILAMTAMVACGNKQNDPIITKLQENITTNEWMCGFPERYVMIEIKKDEESPLSEEMSAILDNCFDTFLSNLAPAFGASSGEEIKGYFACTEMITVTETDPDSGEEFSYEMPKNAPGKLDISDVESIVSLTLFPEEYINELISASIFFNFMNMNNGTFVAFEFEDRFLVASFGLADSTNAFKDAVVATYEGAVVVHDAAL